MLAIHRHLLMQLVVRDVAGRYKGSIGGLAWTVIQPVLMLAVYLFVFGLVFNPRRGAGAPPGDLTAFGLSAPWQAALLLPRDFDDFAGAHESLASVPTGQRALLRACLVCPPSFQTGSPVPRLRLTLRDDEGVEFHATAFGDTRDLQARLVPGEALVARVTVKVDGQRRWVNVIEIAPREWMNRVRPMYPAKPGVASADEVRAAVLQCLPNAIRPAAAHLATLLDFLPSLDQTLTDLGCGGWSLEDLLAQAHLPINETYGVHAQRTLEALAARHALEQVRRQRALRGNEARPLRLPTLLARVRQLPFRLTPEQRQAVRAVADDLARGLTMRHLLVGDVGTGKLHPTCVIAAAAADEQARVLMLQPNVILADQVAAVFRDTWPDVPMDLITAGRPDPAPSARVIVGTTAVLHRRLGAFDLVVVDEAHKFGVAQKHWLVTDRTHMLEATATCIPRTQALAQFGALRVSELRRPPVPKQLSTRILEPGDRHALFAAVMRDVAAGDRVLVIYPLRGEHSDDRDEKGRHTVLRAFQLWERMFPGRVRAVSGADDDAAKSAAVADIVAGRAAVLVSTTVVEAGVNLPRLRRVIVVRPERYGLSTLHQIRGRLAREGGAGACDLYLASPVKEEARRRLEQFAITTDGFRIAEIDLAQRGCGSLAKDGTRQSGADQSFLFGRHLDTNLLADVARGA